MNCKDAKRVFGLSTQCCESCHEEWEMPEFHYEPSTIETNEGAFDVCCTVYDAVSEKIEKHS